MTEQSEQNKKNAITFYDLMFNQSQPAAAIEQYVGAVYSQYNRSGKQGFSPVALFTLYIPIPNKVYAERLSK